MKSYLVQLATAGLCFIVSPAWGDDAIPQSIPLGNQILDLAVANIPCSLVIILQNTNSADGLNTCGFSTNNASFGSYSEFQSFLTMESSGLFNFLNDQNGSDVHYTVYVTYGADAPCPQLTIDTDLGPPAGISAGSFSVTPTFQSVALNIAGAVSANIQFGIGTTNSLVLTSKGILLDSSFLSNSMSYYGAERMRLSIVLENGETATYTQFGNLITPPSLSMFWLPSPPPYDGDEYDDMTGDVYDDSAYWNWYSQYGQYSEIWWDEGGYGCPTYDSYNLLASGTYGADLEIDGTTDFITWTPIATMTWNSYGWSYQMIVPVQMNNPSTDSPSMMFYRANAF